MARRQHAPLPKCQNELRSTARMLRTSYMYPYCAVRSSTCRKTGVKVRPHIFHDCPGWGVQRECARRQALVVAPKRSEVAGDTNDNRTSYRPMSRRSFRSAGLSAPTIAASSVAITFVLLAGFVAGSPSLATEISITTVAR
jgi:hypothetical protein